MGFHDRALRSGRLLELLGWAQCKVALPSAVRDEVPFQGRWAHVRLLRRAAHSANGPAIRPPVEVPDLARPALRQHLLSSWLPSMQRGGARIRVSRQHKHAVVWVPHSVTIAGGDIPEVFCNMPRPTEDHGVGICPTVGSGMYKSDWVGEALASK